MRAQEHKSRNGATKTNKFPIFHFLFIGKKGIWGFLKQRKGSNSILLDMWFFPSPTLKRYSIQKKKKKQVKKICTLKWKCVRFFVLKFALFIAIYYTRLESIIQYKKKWERVNSLIFNNTWKIYIFKKHWISPTLTSETNFRNKTFWLNNTRNYIHSKNLGVQEIKNIPTSEISFTD